MTPHMETLAAGLSEAVKDALLFTEHKWTSYLDNIVMIKGDLK